MASPIETTTVLNTAQPILMKSIINSVENDTVLIKKLKPKNGAEGYDFAKGGYEYRWNVNATAMLQAHAVNERGAVFTPVPRHQTYLAKIAPATIALTMTIDKTEARRATGGTSGYSDPLSWANELFKPSIPLLGKELEQYLFMSTFLDRQVAATPQAFNGLVSLNPEFTSGTVTGNTNGIFDLNAFTDQSKTILSLGANDAYRWATHYNNITGFGGGVGPRIHRRQIGQQRRYARGNPNLEAFQDEASFFTFYEWMDSRVQFVDLKLSLEQNGQNMVSASGTDKTSSFTFFGVTYNLCYNIDVAQYSDSNLKKGVTFILDLNEWRGSLPTPEEMVKSMGEWQDGMKVPTAMANVYACGGTIDLQFWPEYLAGQGMLSGGSV